MFSAATYVRYADRREAGGVLAERLKQYAGRSDVVVLGLPRGGVVVCARTPEPFTAVGLWYADFSETTDEEVRALLSASDTARSAGGAI